MIRLACMMCDRTDGDGIQRVPKGWQDVSRVQSFKQATKTYEPSRAPPGYSVLDWWTHLGRCPDCT